VSDAAPTRGRDRLVLGLVALLLLPPIALAARQLAAGLPDITVGSDPALVELATLDAARGRQLLGPYSRFGFHHPGPAMFYLLLPGYLAGGRTHGGLLLGAVALNLLGLAGVGWASGRLGDRRLALALLVVVPLLVARLGPAGISSAWNPNLVVVAFLATVVSGAAVGLGATALLPLLVAAGSLAAQSHLALVGPVATVVVFAAVLRLLSRARPADDEAAAAPGSGWAVVAAAVIAVAAWAPVVGEQVGSGRGNVTRIAAYLAKERPAQPVEAVFGAYGRAAGSWLVAPIGAAGSGRAAAAAGLALAALQPVALALAVRRRRRPLEALAGVGIALAVIALVTIRGMASPLHEYLTRWIAGLGVVHGAVLMAALLPRRLEHAEPERTGAERGWPVAVVVAALLAAGLNLVRVAGYPSWREQAEAPVFARIGRAGAAALAVVNCDEPVRVSIGEGASWELAAGVVLRLARERRTVGVDPAWSFMFGPAHPAPRNGARLLVCEAGPGCLAGETLWQEEGVRLALLQKPG